MKFDPLYLKNTLKIGILSWRSMEKCNRTISER